MAIIEVEKRGTIAILKMTNGKNGHHLEFAETCVRCLDEIIADEEVTALVITSTDEKNWSQGVDLEWMMERMQAGDIKSIRGFLEGMDGVFKRLLLFPIPVIAAINGHAFGNAAVLALACDFIFMRSDRGYFCFPEVDLGIDFVPGMFAYISSKVPRPKLDELILTGKRLTAPELVEAGIGLKACANLEELTREVFAFAESFQKKRDIFGKHKIRLNQTAVDVFEAENLAYYDTVFGKA